MANCNKTSTGKGPLLSGIMAPLEEGHLERGKAAESQIRRLNAAGEPDESGRIGLMCFSMSNGKREFGRFMKLARGKHSRAVTLVNGGQGGFDALRTASPDSEFWELADSAIKQKKLTRNQIQVAWLKQAVSGETDPYPNHVDELYGYLFNIVEIMCGLYPNLQEVFVSSRIYGGYASKAVSPEPWAREGWFAVEKLVEANMGNRSLPWISYGPYLWADGLWPRGDGLIWECRDFQNDGTHPSLYGEQKVATMLLRFFQESPVTGWFRG